MYKQIDANRNRSRLLVALFIGILAAAGYAYGMATDTGYGGLIFALLISVGMSLGSWFIGDKIVLATSGAQQVESRDQNPYLWNMVENLSIASGVPMPKIYVINDPSPNAFATGRDPKHASIAVTTGIMQLLENEELEGVLAHELSHIQNEDTKLMMLVAVLVGSLTLLGDFFLRGSIFRRRGRSEGGNIFMIVGVLFLVLSPFIGQLIKLAISRRREYLADASGALMTRYPEGLARALEKIEQAAIPMQRASQATAHLWISNPFGDGKRLASWFSTHPPIEDRIRQLRLMTDNR